MRRDAVGRYLGTVCAEVRCSSGKTQSSSRAKVDDFTSGLRSDVSRLGISSRPPTRSHLIAAARLSSLRVPVLPRLAGPASLVKSAYLPTALPASCKCILREERRLHQEQNHAASTPIVATHNTAIMSQPSLAQFVMKRPWMMRWAQPLSRWYLNNAGYRQLGLRYGTSG